MSAYRYRDWTLYRRLLQQARPYWRHIAGLFLLSLLATPLVLLAPLPLKIAVDSIIGTYPFPGFLEVMVPASLTSSVSFKLSLVVGLLLFVALLSHVQALGTWLMQTYTGERMVLDFRARLLGHAQRLSLAYHDSIGTADSIYRIQYDAHAVQNVALEGVIPFVTSAVKVVAVICVTALISLQLALVALAISPLLFLFTHFYRPRLRRRWRDLKELQSAALSVVQEVLSAVRVVKAFGREDHECERFVRTSSEGVRAHVKVVLVECGFSLLLGLTTAAGTAVVLYIGVSQVRAGTLTLGELLMVMAYLAQLYQPLTTLGTQLATLQGALASGERAYSLLDSPRDVLERPHARPVARAAGSVAFRDVSFSYDGNHPVLQGISFEVPEGSRVGISGRTGAGKTTIVSLLTRFYDPVAGEILLDEVDLRDYKVADLRNQFAIVLQEPVLFSASIAENIAYARPEASMGEIVSAASAANANDFIRAMPQGYSTLVGERGMRLSGGERQRISLARAFLKDAPILILDEPTSSIDLKTEQAIMEAMERLMDGRTTFIIAHRLSTLEGCDVTLQLERGRIIREETGSSLQIS